jgi:hypothetical protein
MFDLSNEMMIQNEAVVLSMVTCPAMSFASVHDLVRLALHHPPPTDCGGPYSLSAYAD